MRRAQKVQRVEFLVSGTNSKACIPRVVPPTNDWRLRDDIERRFCGHLRDRRIELMKEVVNRKWTDSLGGLSSSASYGFVDNTPRQRSRFSR